VRLKKPQLTTAGFANEFESALVFSLSYSPGFHDLTYTYTPNAVAAQRAASAVRWSRWLAATRHSQPLSQFTPNSLRNWRKVPGLRTPVPFKPFVLLDGRRIPKLDIQWFTDEKHRILSRTFSIGSIPLFDCRHGRHSLYTPLQLGIEFKICLIQGKRGIARHYTISREVLSPAQVPVGCLLVAIASMNDPQQGREAPVQCLGFIETLHRHVCNLSTFLKFRSKGTCVAQRRD
jgi:hypothetical protein